MKKILVISSSPRKGGNSDTLCDEFIKGAIEAGHNAEKIFLKDHKIEYCRGCLACTDTGKCVIKDDMGALLDKMLSSDVFVMASPVYFYTMCAQMKTFIDRTIPAYREFKNRDIYIIITAEDTDIKMMKKTKLLIVLKLFMKICLKVLERELLFMV